jgi:hypothetical protein
MDTVSAQLRMTFGWAELYRGVNFLVAVIGLFGISEILLTMEERLALRGHAAKISPRVVWKVWKEMPRYWVTLLRSSAIRLLARHYAWRRDRRLVHGLQPGKALLQGAGELRQGAHRGRVRTGNGCACFWHRSAAAHARARHSGLRHGGDLLGGLMVWGLNPGPLLFVEHKDFVWGLIASMYLGNVVGW